MKMRDFIQSLIDVGMNSEASACIMMAEKVTGRKIEIRDGKVWWN